MGRSLKGAALSLALWLHWPSPGTGQAGLLLGATESLPSGPDSPRGQVQGSFLLNVAVFFLCLLPVRGQRKGCVFRAWDTRQFPCDVAGPGALRPDRTPSR